MAPDARQQQVTSFKLRIIGRKDMLSGLMFMAVAIFGLWASRNYPIGTALRMSTGYVPRLLCWILLILGLVIFLQGLRAVDERGAFAGARNWRALLFVPASLVVFAAAMSRLGIVIATVLLITVGSLAGREIRPLEVLGSAIVLVFLTLVIFIWGLELPIPVWPGD